MGGDARRMARPHWLVLRSGGDTLEQMDSRPPQGSGTRAGQPDLRDLGRRRPTRPRARECSRKPRLGQLRARGALGRSRQDLLRPARDVEREFHLSHVRQTPVRVQRPERQQYVARASVVRRIVAQQSPSVPGLRLPRSAMVADRSVRVLHPRPGGCGIRVRRRPHRRQIAEPCRGKK
jgi:hypothetical protein